MSLKLLHDITLSLFLFVDKIRSPGHVNCPALPQDLDEDPAVQTFLPAVTMTIAGVRRTWTKEEPLLQKLNAIKPRPQKG